MPDRGGGYRFRQIVLLSTEAWIFIVKFGQIYVPVPIEKMQKLTNYLTTV